MPVWAVNHVSFATQGDRRSMRGAVRVADGETCIHVYVCANPYTCVAFVYSPSVTEAVHVCTYRRGWGGRYRTALKERGLKKKRNIKKDVVYTSFYAGFYTPKAVTYHDL